jgi:hypothetical protein
MRPPVFLLAAALVSALAVGAGAQRNDALQVSRDHPALDYSAGALTDVVAALNQRLHDGSARLSYEPGTGYLRSLLTALGIPVESQLLVYSKTSFQAAKINEANPRAIYFNDVVSVGYIPGAEVLELAVQDARQGSGFYTLAQTDGQPPELRRSQNCLSCHLSWDTRAVPGRFVLSTHPRKSDNDYANGGVMDHRDPVQLRWGGWYVTGAAVPTRHLGNVRLVGSHAVEPDAMPPAPRLATVAGTVDVAKYATPHSDVVALLVLEHQLHLNNLITWTGWEHRVAEYQARRGAATAAVDSDGLTPRVREAVDELVDYMLFVGEATLPGKVQGASGFAEWFSAQGPRDAQGRSLRELDLDGRLMKYPLSYMIYTPQFEAMPDAVKAAAYRRLWRVLSGEDAAAKYTHLTRPRRQAIAEILRATKSGLPADFEAGVTR